MRQNDFCFSAVFRRRRSIACRCAVKPHTLYRLLEHASRSNAPKVLNYFLLLPLITNERIHNTQHRMTDVFLFCRGRDLVDKPFFPKMLAYMVSGPVVCMAWEGKDVVTMGRKMLGETNPLASNPGTIRGDFALDVSGRVRLFAHQMFLRLPLSPLDSNFFFISP